MLCLWQELEDEVKYLFLLKKIGERFCLVFELRETWMLLKQSIMIKLVSLWIE